MGHVARLTRATVAAVAVLAVSSGASAQPAVVSIGNGNPLPDGSYINAGDLADTLFSSNVTIAATSQLSVVDNINLSVSPSFNTTTLGSLTLRAPIVTISGNVSMGSGNVVLDDGTLNLGDTFFWVPQSGQCPPGCTLTGTATEAYVLGPGANLNQALSAAASGATVQVYSGTYSGNYNVLQPVTLIGSLGASTTPGAGSNAPILSGTIVGGALFTITAVPNVTIEGFQLNANVNGVTSDNSSTGIDATAANSLVANHNFFNGFSLGVAMLFGSNDQVTYNTFANVGTGTTVTATSLTNADIQDNVVVTPAGASAPALNGKAMLALAVLLGASGLFVAKTHRTTSCDLEGA
jgi:hypothetical protein